MYEVTEAFLQEIINYLATRPWAEANGLIVKIDGLVREQNAAKKEGAAVAKVDEQKAA